MGCWPPEGTEDGTVHVLYRDYGGHRVWKHARWHTENQSWTRRLGECETGDFAFLCQATYGWPAEHFDETKKDND